VHDSEPALPRRRRLSKEAIAGRGDHIFAASIEPMLNPADYGKYVAIDVESGDYVVATGEMAAVDRLRRRRPHAQTWLLRVGYRCVRHYRSPRRRMLWSHEKN